MPNMKRSIAPFDFESPDLRRLSGRRYRRSYSRVMPLSLFESHVTTQSRARSPLRERVSHTREIDSVWERGNLQSPIHIFTPSPENTTSRYNPAPGSPFFDDSNSPFGNDVDVESDYEEHTVSPIVENNESPDYEDAHSPVYPPPFSPANSTTRFDTYEFPTEVELEMEMTRGAEDMTTQSRNGQQSFPSWHIPVSSSFSAPAVVREDDTATVIIDEDLPGANLQPVEESERTSDLTCQQTETSTGCTSPTTQRSTEQEVRSPESSSPLNDVILGLLKCPVCLEYCTPPIFQCTKGHIVCGSCKPRVNRCPTCRDASLEIKCLILEQLSSSIMYPCRNIVSGCNMKISLEQKKPHEENCKFRTFSCPLHLQGTCRWEGLANEMVPHVHLVHPTKIRFSNSTEISINLQPVQFPSFMILSCFDNTFVFSLLLQKERETFNPVVRYIGPNSNAKDYEYKFSMRFNSSPHLSSINRRECSLSRTVYTFSEKKDRSLKFPWSLSSLTTLNTTVRIDKVNKD